MKYDLIIIGSGSVGATAGYYATRAGLKVLMMDAHMLWEDDLPNPQT